MPKRFIATELWDEDWFLEMPNEYKLFWHYMLSACDHAGVFRVNVKSFSAMIGEKINAQKALEYFNSGKQRIKVISDTAWLIEDFFVFQYGNQLNRGNKLHKSCENIYNKHNINALNLRGLSRGIVEGKKGAT